tara:strand:- start:6181 stop:7785 length:1605 start_codon:yes stop_codon:yes gene_type:complete
MLNNKMKFKTLTDEQKEKLKEIYQSKHISWDEKEKELKKYSGRSARTTRVWCAKLGYTKPNETASPQYDNAKKNKVGNNKRFLISWCQSNTEINLHMLKNMEAYAEEIGAEILIIPGKYSFNMFEAKTEGHTWHSKTIKYLNSSRHDICDTLSYCGDINILPTGKYPLSTMGSINGMNSAIYGSPKLNLESHPVLQGDDAKVLVTTGALSKPNYSDSKAGNHGKHYHQYGFVVVELQSSTIFHMRQVEVSANGSFDDLFFHVEKGEITRNTEIEGIVLGDLHYATVDQKALKTTFGLMKKLKPKHVILEDLLDGRSINPHNLDDPFYQAKLEYDGNNDLADEIKEMLTGLKKFEKFENVVVVKSNHDIFLERFLKRDWRKLPTMKNSLTYMELSAKILRCYKEGIPFKGVVPMLVTENFPKFHALGYDEPYYIKHFAVFNHGEKGSNGSRGGGAKNWAKFASGSEGHRERGVITAHTHTPSRYGNSICVGHLLLPQDYTSGSPSSWMQSNCIVHKSGKAQQIHIIDSKYYTTLK